MATKLEKLLFAIGMRDEASGKLGKLQQSIDRTCRQVRNNFEGIKSGALSAAGSGMALYQMVTPAVDFNRAVGEVSSLGVADDALNYLQGQAKNFALQYGGNAAEVIRASYDIQSAIAGLQGKELGTFTVASATLAKATKADAATITSYMGTMYGIFKNQADSMGKGAWVEQLAGRTALAVQMFKTTGTEMARAFTALGANATAAGISAQEQMAVLGMLQSTMNGSEAGTKYKSFLAGIGNAQKELGLKFTDKKGNMLGIEAILGKIKGKFGETLDVDESDLLKKAFGSDEAVSMIKQLLADTKGLSQNIDALGKVTGMEKAKQIAAKMTDVWGRMGAASALVKVRAEEHSEAWNLGPGYYSILPKPVPGVASAHNNAEWLESPGADVESDDALRLRCRNQFAAVGQYHHDAAYRALIAEFAGIRVDYIFFEKDAPRGPGTANAHIMVESGVPPQELIDCINAHVRESGNHGHGDDMRALPITPLPVELTVLVYPPLTLSADKAEALRKAAEGATLLWEDIVPLRQLPVLGTFSTELREGL